MGKELKKLIDFNIRRYKKTFDSKLGMDENDIRSDIMFQVWKGIVTHKKNKKANLKTYVSTLIANRFKLLAKKSAAKKFSIITYMDSPSDKFMSTEDIDTFESCETLFDKREQVMRNLGNLSEIEQKVMLDLIGGYNLRQMVERNGMNLPSLIAAIKKIEAQISKRSEDNRNAKQ